MSDLNAAEAVVEAFNAWWAQTPEVQSVEVVLDADDLDVSLDQIASQTPGQGLARPCLARLCELADEHGVSVKGAAWGQLGEGTRQQRFDNLKAWYERSGFVVDYDPESNFVYRPPQPKPGLRM